MLFNLKGKNKAASVWPLVIFMIGFYALDCLLTFGGWAVGNKFIVLLMLPFAFISFVLKERPLEYLKLNSNIKKGILWGVIISSLNALIYCAFWYFKNGTIALDWSGGFKNFWSVILLGPFAEEIIFRGLALGYLRNIYSFKTANIVSSLLFMLFHVPYWITVGQFSLPLYKLSYEFVRLFVIGLFWGFLVKKTNSLWASIIHHSTNNFLASMVR